MLRALAGTLVLSSLAAADTAVPGSSSASSLPEEHLVCTTPRPLAQVCPCMVAETDAFWRKAAEQYHNADLAQASGPCKLIGPEEVRGVRLVRLSSDGTADAQVYPIVNGPGGWRVIHEVAHESNHSHHDNRLIPIAQTEVRLGGVRVYRLDYRYDYSGGGGDGEYFYETEGSSTSTLLCPIAGVAGTPRCTLDVMVRCHELSEEYKEDGSSHTATRTTGAAALAIAPDGTVTVTRTASGSGQTCLDHVGRYHIW
jgi:hypothetical protein